MRVGAAALPEKGSETFNCPLNSYELFDKNKLVLRIYAFVNNHVYKIDWFAGVGGHPFMS